MNDTERLEFLISVLNCWDMYGDFVNAYHQTKRTTRQRAESAEWRESIDSAIVPRPKWSIEPFSESVPFAPEVGEL